jgi:hypothetical protein
LQNATVDDVFKAACKETGLAYRIQDKTVEIFPAK